MPGSFLTLAHARKIPFLDPMGEHFLGANWQTVPKCVSVCVCVGGGGRGEGVEGTPQISRQTVFDRHPIC